MAIESIAVLIVVIAVVKLLLSRGTLTLIFGPVNAVVRQTQKRRFSTSILLGMDFLVAGDLVKSVVLELTTSAVSALGLLIFVRTFLAWALIIESDHRWPWQSTIEK